MHTFTHFLCEHPPVETNWFVCNTRASFSQKKTAVHVHHLLRSIHRFTCCFCFLWSAGLFFGQWQSLGLAIHWYHEIRWNWIGRMWTALSRDQRSFSLGFVYGISLPLKTRAARVLCLQSYLYNIFMQSEPIISRSMISCGSFHRWMAWHKEPAACQSKVIYQAPSRASDISIISSMWPFAHIAGGRWYVCLMWAIACCTNRSIRMTRWSPRLRCRIRCFSFAILRECLGTSSFPDVCFWSFCFFLQESSSNVNQRPTRLRCHFWLGWVPCAML